MQFQDRYDSTCSSVENRQQHLISMHAAVSQVHTQLQEIDHWLRDAEKSLEKSRSDSMLKVTQSICSRLPGHRRRFETLRETVGKLCVTSEAEVPADTKLRERVNTLGVDVERVRKKVYRCWRSL